MSVNEREECMDISYLSKCSRYELIKIIHSQQELVKRYKTNLREIYHISTFDHDERFLKETGYNECIRMAREALGIELKVYDHVEKRLPEGTKIRSKEDGETYTICGSTETNNQFGYGIYFYRVKERLDTGFGLYKKWFDVI